MTSSPDQSNIQRASKKEGESWLQKLKNRSWEMDLLLSGFVLVLLLPLPTYIERESVFLTTGIEFGIYQSEYASCSPMLSGLICHFHQRFFIHWSEIYFHRKKFNGQTGIITYLPIKNLPSGMNLLKIEKNSLAYSRAPHFSSVIISLL